VFEELEVPTDELAGPLPPPAPELLVALKPLPHPCEAATTPHAPKKSHFFIQSSNRTAAPLR
jgi:hypothetical protein